ncbi:MAG TPA: hypothetical protein VFS08_09685 [Gemmatimonadaceae bacterium]|nr:hypothetical protein [Gemmatimonadaceae bacterium]
MSAIIRHPHPALVGSAALAVAALLAGCTDLPTAEPPKESGKQGVILGPTLPADRCEPYVEIARLYASFDNLQHFCFTARLRPDVWSADYPDPQRRECECMVE